MQADSIVATILLRERYRRDRLEYVIRMALIASFLAVLMVAGNVAVIGKGTSYRFVMTDPTGKILDLVPLVRPNKPDDIVAKWAVDAVTRTYTFDFRNYRRQFLNAQKVLTQTGWDGFEKALVDSGNFVAVTDNQFVTTAVPTGPATVVSSGILRDAIGNQRFGWTVEFPMLVTYRNNKNTVPQRLNVRAVVVRMPEFINPDGLGIRQIIAQ